MFRLDLCLILLLILVCLPVIHVIFGRMSFFRPNLRLYFVVIVQRLLWLFLGNRAKGMELFFFFWDLMPQFISFFWRRGPRLHIFGTNCKFSSVYIYTRQYFFLFLFFFYCSIFSHEGWIPWWDPHVGPIPMWEEGALLPNYLIILHFNHLYLKSYIKNYEMYP